MANAIGSELRRVPGDRTRCPRVQVGLVVQLCERGCIGRRRWSDCCNSSGPSFPLAANATLKTVMGRGKEHTDTVLALGLPETQP